MRNRNLTMGEMSEFMAQNDSGVANFARKRRGGRRRKKGMRKGAIAGGIGAAAALGLATTGTKKGRRMIAGLNPKVRRGRRAAGMAMSAIPTQRLLPASVTDTSNAFLRNKAGARVRRK